MEKLRIIVNEIAYTQDYSKLSITQRSLIPLLALSSSLYSVALSLRRYLYRSGIFSKHRLAVPVISVGNLTWGGNGKTPMVKFIAQFLAHSRISPLILTRGYAGGDEAKMLARHLGKSVKIGIGANRAAVAASFLKQYGHRDPHGDLFKGSWADSKIGSTSDSEKIDLVVLDDGMQHWSLHRDLEIVMINGLSPWGNCQLIPLGPLREPLTALRRADVAVVHHANLATEQNLKDIEIMVREIKESLPIFFTGIIPSHFLEVGNINFRIPLSIIHNAVVLCVSAIGSARAFVQGMGKMGAFHVDRIDFSDHHLFQTRDIETIMTKLRALEDKLGSKPVVVLTEKDYDRDPEILRHMSPFKVLVLCSELEIIPKRGHTEDSFRKLLKQLLETKW
ncbi:probable tetraacyldisaccharide 4'-kinase, mitochondrial [Mercurialis annua]|uniref:probable tetraacyldisaccharide 4'-kinase, mitochondrial n=1 Tax=Mercurialis annua TaxID=3986 RepID=UPI00215EE5A6|nr:probable tetraacyldisaccharide 4'-kinase, mitochondrial [Mercurialis annua]